MKTTHNQYSRITAKFPDVDDIMLYYVDEKESTVKEFLIIIDRCFRNAVKKQYLLFKKYETIETNVELRVCKN